MSVICEPAGVDERALLTFIRVAPAARVNDLVGVVQRLSLARPLPEIQEIVRTAARRLTGADGATFVLRDGQCCYYADEDEATRALIIKATCEKRFRPWAVRIDSAVIEADAKYPTDVGLASSRVRVLDREPRRLAKPIGDKQVRARDRTRAMGLKLKAITRTIGRRSSEAKAEVLKLTGETGALLERSVTEARVAKIARSKARGRGAKAKLKAAVALEEMADLCEKVTAQIRQRAAGKPIKDRIVSLHDPDARPIRKGSPTTSDSFRSWRR